MADLEHLTAERDRYAGLRAACRTLVTCLREGVTAEEDPTLLQAASATMSSASRLGERIYTRRIDQLDAEIAQAEAAASETPPED